MFACIKYKIGSGEEIEIRERSGSDTSLLHSRISSVLNRRGLKDILRVCGGGDSRIYSVLGGRGSRKVSPPKCGYVGTRGQIVREVFLTFGLCPNMNITPNI